MQPDGGWNCERANGSIRSSFDTTINVLRALDYFRAARAPADPRLREAVEQVRSKRRPDGRWASDRQLAGRVWFELDDGPGRPSRWITLRALRVLKWWDESV